MEATNARFSWFRCRVRIMPASRVRQYSNGRRQLSPLQQIQQIDQPIVPRDGPKSRQGRDRNNNNIEFFVFSTERTIFAKGNNWKPPLAI